MIGSRRLAPLHLVWPSTWDDAWPGVLAYPRSLVSFLRGLVEYPNVVPGAVAPGTQTAILILALCEANNRSHGV